jgi:uncharacterized protein DUF6973
MSGYYYYWNYGYYTGSYGAGSGYGWGYGFDWGWTNWAPPGGFADYSLDGGQSFYLGLTEEESAFMYAHPGAAASIALNGWIANSEFPGGGLEDAERHAYWTAMNAADVGTSLALEFAAAHEDFHGNAGFSMDMYNNTVGADINAILVGMGPGMNTSENILGMVLIAGDLGYLDTTPGPN